MLKIAYSPIYAHPLPEGHKFPMQKYELIPQTLLDKGIVRPENFFCPRPVSEYWITRTHTPAYWEGLKTLTTPPAMVRRIGFPLSAALVERELIITQGTIDCALYALRYGVAMNVAGGTHHAFADAGEGFCLLNDMAIASNYLLDKGLAEQILIVDLDVHQGNGTAAIFANEPRVFTFSMHGARNYPFTKPPSNLDIALPDACDDELYICLLDKALQEILTQVRPDFVFFQSGVDVLATDKLGLLGLTQEGCQRRDFLVLEACMSAEIPIVAVMGGGYSADIQEIVKAHVQTYQTAQQLFYP